MLHGVRICFRALPLVVFVRGAVCHNMCDSFTTGMFKIGSVNIAKRVCEVTCSKNRCGVPAISHISLPCLLRTHLATSQLTKPKSQCSTSTALFKNCRCKIMRCAHASENCLYAYVVLLPMCLCRSANYLLKEEYGYCFPCKIACIDSPLLPLLCPQLDWITTCSAQVKPSQHGCPRCSNASCSSQRIARSGDGT